MNFVVEEFQTLIGTVKRPRLDPPPLGEGGVSNPHRHGQKHLAFRKPRGLIGVSNPHRYGQKVKGGKKMARIRNGFQTLIGTVKRRIAFSIPFGGSPFQTLIGTVKRSMIRTMMPIEELFQTLIGTVKSLHP